MKLLLLLLFIIQIVSSLSTPPPTRKEITSLPGWNDKLPSKMYSGYIESGSPPNNNNGQMYTHYWFIESENSPSTDPLLLWYNGGPGASSLFGLLVELGPLLLNDQSLQDPLYNKTGIPQLIRNNYGWSKNANLLVTDNPVPVGFSYCDPVGPSGDGYSCGSWNDSLTANMNHKFITNWFRTFPEFAGRDFFIVGESYAGVYVPTILQTFFENPDSNVNIKGIAVGDGCIGTDVLCGASSGPYYYVDWMHGHGQYSQKLYYQILDECSEIELRIGNLTTQCKSLVSRINGEIGGYYGYNLYDDCTDRHIFMNKPTDFHGRKYWGPPAINVNGALNDYSCPGPAMGMWLNRSDVRDALSIVPKSTFNSADNGEGMTYNLTEKNVLPIYLEAAMKRNIRVLLYNGDTDPGINSFITQDIFNTYFSGVAGLNITHDWHPWTLDGSKRMGGYVTQWLNGKLAFLTIRGSGHMVPEFKPAAASIFINAFLQNQPYPKYCPSC